MAKVDLARRAAIGREKRARTRAQIVDAAAALLADRPIESLTVSAVVEAAGVAKGTFYYHFESMEHLAAAVGASLRESFDELVTPARRKVSDPVARIAFAFEQFLDKAIADPAWARLLVESASAPGAPDSSSRANLKSDIAEAMAQGRLALWDVELAADVTIGIWVQVARGIIERGPRPLLKLQAIEAVLRALGASHDDWPGRDSDAPQGADAKGGKR